MLLSFLLVFIYLLYIITKFGIPHSISLSYYLIKYKWIFSIVLISSSALIFPAMLELNYPHLAFIGLAAILFVAFAPNFMDDELVDKVHTWSAIVALISSLIWIGLNTPLILLEWIPLIIYLIVKLSVDKIIFYGEISMLLTIYTLLIVS